MLLTMGSNPEGVVKDPTGDSGSHAVLLWDVLTAQMETQEACWKTWADVGFPFVWIPPCM